MKELLTTIEKIKEIFDDLTPREQKVLNLRFGLEDGIRRSYGEVGREFGVTRERIRQIEARIFEKYEHQRTHN